MFSNKKTGKSVPNDERDRYFYQNKTQTIAKKNKKQNKTNTHKTQNLIFDAATRDKKFLFEYVIKSVTCKLSENLIL